MVAPAKPYRNPTPKEEAFAQAVAHGKPLVDAFRIAYPGRSDKPHHAKQEAYKIAQRPPVAARIKELQKPELERFYLSRARKRELLYTLAENPRNSPIERIRAIDMDNLMTGEYKQNIRVEGEVTLGVILKNLASTTGIPSEEERAMLDVKPEATVQPETGPERAPQAQPGPLGDDFNEVEA
jgi:hypothetical protein